MSIHDGTAGPLSFYRSDFVATLDEIGAQYQRAECMASTKRIGIRQTKLLIEGILQEGHQRRLCPTFEVPGKLVHRILLASGLNRPGAELADIVNC